jgi:hypothetical protein
MSQGKGISDAVRRAIQEWMVPEILDSISAALGFTVHRHELGNPRDWVRCARRLNPNGTGWERDYVRRAFPPVTPRVHTNTQEKMLVEKLFCIFIMCLSVATAAIGQQIDAPEAQKGMILGTAVDVNGGTISGATVALAAVATEDKRIVGANDGGFFELTDLEPGTSYQLTISAPGFANWTSPIIILRPGQCLILTEIKLRVAEELTTVNVHYSSMEVATEQVKIEEQQRVFGIIPNFYVVYDQNAEPLTTKLKFKLALKVSTDPVTFLGVGGFAGIQQAAHIPNYVQGAKGYGQRLGAGAADGFANIMIGGAILPSLLHQDPRYFYQGTGTNKSRALHALSSPFICRGGELATASLANAYYPASNRGAGMVFGNFLISTGERLVSSLAQEFILGRVKSKAKNKY